MSNSQTTIGFKAMAEGSPLNLMSCDSEGNINYLNPAATETLESIEDSLPIAVKDIVGSTFDVFHKDPSYQQKLLKNPVAISQGVPT